MCHNKPDSEVSFQLNFGAFQVYKLCSKENLDIQKI